MTATRARGIGARSKVLIGACGTALSPGLLTTRAIGRDPVTRDTTTRVAALDDARATHAPLTDRFADATMEGAAA